MGWGWFAISLDDGRSIMAFVVHGEGGDQMVGAGITNKNCVTCELKAEEFKVKAEKPWTGPDSKCAWTLSSQVEGDATGRAYVELTGCVPGK